MEKLLVIEIDGINDIAGECATHGGHPIFLKTHSYHNWLPLDSVNAGAEIRNCGDPSYFDIVKLMIDEDVQSILPISLLEPEGVRDSLVKDYIQTHNMPVNIVANSSATMEATFDKWLTKEILAGYDIPVTPGKLIRSVDDLPAIEAEFNFPMILKERKSYTGMGIRILNNTEDLRKYVARNIQKGLFAEPFVPGSEVSLEVITWDGKMIFQPLVYKGETRLNILEHPAYRPRISPYRRNTDLEKKIIGIVGKSVEKLQLKGAAEFEFIIVNDEPFIMEINPRISGITRLCSAAGGVNVYRELAYISMNKTFSGRQPLEKTKYAMQFPLTVLPEGEFLQELKNNPAVSYIKPITWMPLLPIKSNIIISYDTIDELIEGMMSFEQYTHPKYIEEAKKSLQYF